MNRGFSPGSFAHMAVTWQSLYKVVLISDFRLPEMSLDLELLDDMNVSTTKEMEESSSYSKSVLTVNRHGRQ